MAVAAPRRRANCDEHSLRLAHRREIIGECQPVLADVGHHQFGEAGLIDWHLAGFQRLDLRGIVVDATDIVAEIRKTGARDQAHISRAHHSDLHFSLLKRRNPRRTCSRNLASAIFVTQRQPTHELPG